MALESSSEQHPAGEESRWRIAFAVLLVAAVLYLIANVSREYALERRLDAMGRNAALVVAGTDRPAPLANLTELQDQLVRAPVDQAMLNHFLTARKENGGWQANEYEALEKLGYRSSVAQLNLLTLAAERSDWAEAVRRTDALLRRRRASLEVRTVMFLAESTPEGRAQLARSLRDWPEWADPYFVDSRYSQLEGGVDARLELFAAAREIDAPLPRNAAALSAFHMARMNRFDAAHSLFVEYEEGTGLGITDPEFEQLAQYDADDGQAFPFDWKLLETDGSRARVRNQSDETTVTLRWDGRGNPRFMEKTVRLDQPVPELRFSVPIGDLQNAARILQLEWQCLGLETQARDIGRGRADAANSELVFAAPLLPECEYAKLTLKGLSSGMDTRYLIKLNGVSAS